MGLLKHVGDEASEVEDLIIFQGWESTYWPLDYDASYFELTSGWNAGAGEIAQYMLFDRDGRCRWAHVGQLTDTSGLENAINELL